MDTLLSSRSTTCLYTRKDQSVNCKYLFALLKLYITSFADSYTIIIASNVNLQIMMHNLKQDYKPKFTIHNLYRLRFYQQVIYYWKEFNLKRLYHYHYALQIQHYNLHIYAPQQRSSIIPDLNITLFTIYPRKSFQSFPGGGQNLTSFFAQNFPPITFTTIF